MKSPPVYIEISQSWLKALREQDGLELPLERGTNGRLTAGCKEKLITGLQKFLDRKTWQPRADGFCAIGASGVSLRHLTLPASAKEEFQRLLRLQIENEFPLSPDELAWGWQRLESNDAAAKQEILVAAVKKEVVEDYASVLLSCGVNPVFTLAALARGSLCPPPLNACALLDIGRGHSELATFDKGVPSAVRVFNSSADASVADSVVRFLGANWSGKKIFLSGAADDLAAEFTRRLGTGVACEPLKVESGPGRSAAILGLKKSVGQNGGSLPLILQVKAKPANGSFDLSQPDAKKWARLAAALLCALLILPYAEALVLKPFLARRIARLRTEKEKTSSMLGRELDFLQFLKQNQPPYLDALFLFSKSAPQGARIDSLTLNRRGDVSLRGSMRDAQQVTEFRTKLIGSGYFEKVAVEEQAPTPDRQKVNVRISAQWKPVAARAGLAIGPTAEEIEKAKKGSTDTQPGGAPGMPPGMMPERMPPSKPAKK